VNGRKQRTANCKRVRELQTANCERAANRQL
jgi:hypothetical protein